MLKLKYTKGYWTLFIRGEAFVSFDSLTSARNAVPEASVQYSRFTDFTLLAIAAPCVLGIAVCIFKLTTL